MKGEIKARGPNQYEFSYSATKPSSERIIPGCSLVAIPVRSDVPNCNPAWKSTLPAIDGVAEIFEGHHTCVRSYGEGLREEWLAKKICQDYLVRYEDWKRARGEINPDGSFIRAGAVKALGL